MTVDEAFSLEEGDNFKVVSSGKILTIERVIDHGDGYFEYSVINKNDPDYPGNVIFAEWLYGDNYILLRSK